MILLTLNEQWYSNGMTKLHGRRILFLIGLVVSIYSALPAQTSEAKGFAFSGGFDFHPFNAELDFHPFSPGGLGGVLAAEYRFTERIGAGIRNNITYMFNGDLAFEFTLFGRWYFKPFGKRRSQFLVDLSGFGAVPIFTEDAARITPSFNILGAWRIPLGPRWFVEPYVRASYPFIFTAGAMLGYRFPPRESIVYKDAPPKAPEPELPQPGVYVGILSFGPYVEDKTAGCVYLNESGYQALAQILTTSYVKSATPGTSLYYAVHSALARLSTDMPSFPFDVASVSIITFTDGLDNNSTSLALAPLEGQRFSSTEAYRDYIQGQLVSRMIAGQPISAFSVGIRGSDVGDSAEFTASLAALATEEANAYEINYTQLNGKLAEIAAALTEQFTEEQFVLTTPSYAENTTIRLTFDVPDTGTIDQSRNYIEGIVTRANGGYELSTIAYSGSIASAIPRGGKVAGVLNGTEVAYTFPSFTGYDPLNNTMRQWVCDSEGIWHGNSEYSARTAARLSEQRRSAVVYLVLDGSSSLNDADLRVVRESAQEFLRALLTGKPTPNRPVVVQGARMINLLGNMMDYMALVPGNQSFPTGIDDSGVAFVARDFLLGKSEVTYALWETVCDWAGSATRGLDRYTFVNRGVQGAGSATQAQHPVTTISWHDALVWCNALTEYYNAATGAALTPVYQDANGIVRDARGVGGMVVLPMDSADGFRLPTSDEWELSARWRGADTMYTVRKNDWATNPINFTQGNAASGAAAAYTNSVETGAVAVSGQSGTAPVKSRKPNALGLYDMSGNVWEWCFDAKGAGRAVRGGAWGMDTNNVSIGGTLFRNPTDARDTVGFRVARNVDD
jgi:formylglycine-generating enzyme required for sulfatase activity